MPTCEPFGDLRLPLIHLLCKLLLCHPFFCEYGVDSLRYVEVHIECRLEISVPFSFTPLLAVSLGVVLFSVFILCVFFRLQRYGLSLNWQNVNSLLYEFCSLLLSDIICAWLSNDERWCVPNSVASEKLVRHPLTLNLYDFPSFCILFRSLVEHKNGCYDQQIF